MTTQRSVEPAAYAGTAPQQKRLVPTLYIVLGVVVVLGLAALFLFGVVWLARSFPGEIEVVRDILLIAFALESCLFGIVLLLLLIMVIRLVNMLEYEIKPILNKTNETIGMVRGTSAFVSDNVVKPTISARSYVAGIRQGFKALLGNPRRNLPD